MGEDALECLQDPAFSAKEHQLLQLNQQPPAPPAATQSAAGPSVDDLLKCDTTASTASSQLLSASTASAATSGLAGASQGGAAGKSSRQRGLEELDFLGEAAIKSHLPQKSPQFAKRGEKVSMNALQEQ